MEESKDIAPEQKSKIETSPESTTIKQSLKDVDDLITKGNELVRTYKAEIDDLRGEVSKMEGAVISIVLETDKSTSPMLAFNLGELSAKVNSQKDENAKLQKQLTDLRKEKAQTQQTIYTLEARITTLEKEYGVK